MGPPTRGVAGPVLRYEMADVLLVIAAVGALLNGWQISRMAGRVDAMESHVQASLSRLSAEIADVNTRIDNVLLADRDRAR